MNEIRLPTAAEPVVHLLGDAQATLAQLPAGSVDCCVTSPPYYGLRDYGTAQWEGGNPECDHRPARLKASRNEDRPTFGDSYATHGTQLIAHGKRKACEKCGAVKTDLQVGLEDSPSAYVARMVDVFREVRRVLRDDGSLWLNLGDSYATKPNGPNSSQSSALHGSLRSHAQSRIAHAQRSHAVPEGLKHKDLIGIPWAVAFALRADGWYLRQDVIWAKPNPMPESCRDRCTKSHEYMFLLTKSARYHFDAAAIAEPCASPTVFKKTPSGWDTSKGEGGHGSFHKQGRANGVKVNGGASFGKQRTSADGTGAQSRKYERPVYTKRNKRSVWVISTRGFKGAHFATFPPDLIRPCVLASCRTGGVVLDPFAGSGTTLQVARGLGRLAVGIELNPEYHALIRKRLAA